MMAGRDDAAIRISVTPEPIDEELAAVVAVVTALAASAPPVDRPRNRSGEGERWQLLGRHEAMRGPFWPPDIAENS
jgi:hypothetical protein